MNKQVKQTQSRITVGTMVVLHWAMYWLMNGLDKFWNRTDLGFFTWYGKDRTTQFTTYFERTSIPVDILEPLLTFTGIVEFIFFVPLAIVSYCLLTKKFVSRRIFELGFTGTIAIFSAFSFCDIIFGDRSELLEHGTFMATALISYKIAMDEFKHKNIFAEYSRSG